MKDGQCPKCGSHEVHVRRENIGSNLRTGTVNEARLDAYICINCGYIEYYLSDKEKLRQIAEKWPQVGEE
ncbi:MAG TPA: zinc ribbon domain-containing protein [Chloroflexia bacterium]|jgi:predicted nucleic-acid-binding Zn-ribbon protein|nr:zinc ribbon domain-containing protein [Chloroflexia bacterium]